MGCKKATSLNHDRIKSAFTMRLIKFEECSFEAL
jgi:hypothetical protein